jgi:Raf kinase inhibitor-like YbhB/YbcL family protein
MAFSISSPSFRHEQSIPQKHTCEGEDVSPALHFADPPERAASLALVIADPDAPDPKAPKRTFSHWIVYDLPADTASLEEGVSPKELPHGTLQGKNDFGSVGYRGPCPPIGRHRYFFKLYALDRRLGNLGSPTREDLEAKMKGHVIAEAQLMGTYEKHAGR